MCFSEAGGPTDKDDLSAGNRMQDVITASDAGGGHLSTGDIILIVIIILRLSALSPSLPKLMRRSFS